MDERYLGMPGKQTQESASTQYETQNTSELLNYLNIEPEFRQIIADISGQRWDYTKEIFVHDPLSKPLCNQDGIKAIVRTLRAYFSKSAIMNELETKEVNMIMHHWREFVKKLIVYDETRIKYGIDVTDRWQIAEILSTAPYLNLLRSRDSHEMDAITKIVKSHEEVKQSMEGAKRSFNPFRIIMRRRD